MVAAKRLAVGLVLGEKVQFIGFQTDNTLHAQIDIYALYGKNFYFSSLYLISTVTLFNFHGDCVKPASLWQQLGASVSSHSVPVDI